MKEMTEYSLLLWELLDNRDQKANEFSVPPSDIVRALWSLPWAFSACRPHEHWLDRWRDVGRDAPDEHIVARTAVDIVVDKALLACRETGIECLVAAGGVAANTYLRQRLDEAPVRTVYPSLALCTDNAAMIGGLGYQLLARGERSGLEVNARARVGEFRARYP